MIDPYVSVDTHPLIRTDDRLRYARGMVQQPMLGVREEAVLPSTCRARPAPGQSGARTETNARSSNDDDAHIRVGAEGVEAVEEALLELRCPGVERFGPVEREEADPAWQLAENDGRHKVSGSHTVFFSQFLN